MPIEQQLPTIYLDEAGNTGPDLMNADQPVFTLASCVFSVDEANQLLKLVGSKSTHETHFKRLRRRKSGQDGIIRLMDSELVCVEKVAVNIFLKEFMITTKIVDQLIEDMFHRMGRDLYVNGQT